MTYRRYDYTLRGLRVRPSAQGVMNQGLGLDRRVRATLIGINSSDATLLRLLRDGRTRPETWARQFWIPLRGHKQWRLYPMGDRIPVRVSAVSRVAAES